MNRKKSRLKEIVEILTHETISSQEELLARLDERGISVTQATLSRDLKRLRTIKVAGENGQYRYVMTGASTWTAGSEESSTINTIKDSSRASLFPLSMKLSGNMIVFKTRNGYAGGLAYDIDSLDTKHILGTIAGADTVFAVVNSASSNQEIALAFEPIIPKELIEKALFNDADF